MPGIRTATTGILSDDRTAQREELVEMLKKAYWMEIETVMSYIASSINPDGVRAQEIIESLQEDIQEELGHAQQFASRIKELYGVVPGSLEFAAEQSYLQPPEHQTDIVHVIKGVIEAETGAIEHYNRVIEFTDGLDLVTQDMVIAILRDEEGHRRLFEGYLREYEAEGLAPNIHGRGGPARDRTRDRGADRRRRRSARELARLRGDARDHRARRRARIRRLVLRRAAPGRRQHRARREGARGPVQVRVRGRVRPPLSARPGLAGRVPGGDPHGHAPAAQRDPGGVLGARRHGSRAATAAARGRVRVRPDRAAAGARHRDRRPRAGQRAVRASLRRGRPARGPGPGRPLRARARQRAAAHRRARVERRAAGDPRRHGGRGDRAVARGAAGVRERRRGPPPRLRQRGAAAVGAAPGDPRRGSRCATTPASRSSTPACRGARRWPASAPSR